MIVADDVREEVLRHLRRSQDEQGGLLLGEVFADDEQLGVATSRAVVVSQAVPALDFASSGISLRMESGVWERARAALRPLELIVGWYHSHPGLGAFFSATDRRTQAAFFPHPYSVGWVTRSGARRRSVFRRARVRGAGRSGPRGWSRRLRFRRDLHIVAPHVYSGSARLAVAPAARRTRLRRRNLHPAASCGAHHLCSRRRSRLRCGPCVHDGACLVVTAVGPAAARALVSRPARARVGLALRRGFPLGRADRHDGLDTGSTRP